jgi:hypothetical protein
MSVPVLLKTRARLETTAAVYYEVAENGVFTVHDTPLYLVVTRARGPLPGLLPESEQLRLRVPPLPRTMVEEVLAFFEGVYHRHGGEAVVVLFYDDPRRSFRIVAPPQTVPGRRRHDGRWLADHAVRYGPVERPDGFLRLGTIHSHADLPAYASADDCHDEQYEDGLHLVFGSLHVAVPTVSAAFVSNGVRFLLDPADVLEAWERPARAARPDWMAQVRRESAHEHAAVSARSGDSHDRP